MNTNTVLHNKVILTCSIGLIPIFSFGTVDNYASTIGAVCHLMGVHDDVEQGKITGIVVDGHNQPVDFASVSLLNVNDSSFIAGAVTDKSGMFEIPCVLDKVIVKFSCVGYSTISRIYEPAILVKYIYMKMSSRCKMWL